MLQKRHIGNIIRHGGVLLLAVFCLYGFISCSSDDSASLTLSDVFANDVSVVYDGRPHSVSVFNTLNTDTVLFSLDNIAFLSSCPEFYDVGEYIVYFKVFRKGYREFSSYATITILPTVLSGISAKDISAVYDGIPRSISISGILDSDTITYSLDGLSFSSDIPSFTEVGEYTVYYRVQRPYGDYRSSCTVTIYPNLFGRYFNSDFGVVELSEYNVTFTDVSGSGLIYGEQFRVTDNILYYKALSFTLLSDSDCVYRLIVSDTSLFFVSGSSGKLTISFSDNRALIQLSDDVILSLPDYNYCESGDVIDYCNLCFEQPFIQSSDITDINVVLSFRAINRISFDAQFFTYDGLPHSFSFTVPVVFLSDEKEFVAVGRHTVSVAVLSDSFLPCVIDCVIVILPDISGVYLSSSHVIQILDGVIYLDGTSLGELSVLDDNWAYNNLSIIPTDDGILFDSVLYSSVSDPVLVVKVNGQFISAVSIPDSIDQVVGTYDGTALVLTVKNTLLLSVALCGSISVSLNDVQLNTVASDGSISFFLGHADISAPVVVLNVKCE